MPYDDIFGGRIKRLHKNSEKDVFFGVFMMFLMKIGVLILLLVFMMFLVFGQVVRFMV